MGLILFAVLAGLEIALTVMTCRAGGSRSVWRHDRLIIRGIQAAVLAIALLVPEGQKWRWIPVMGWIMLLLAIAAVSWFAQRNKDGSLEKKPENMDGRLEKKPENMDGSLEKRLEKMDGRLEKKPKKKAVTLISCIMCVLLTGAFMIPAFVFTGYEGLPVNGNYTVGEASAILVDGSRKDPFEQDGSFREVPVHLYYPEDAEGQYPLIVFSHGAFGYYQSNTSTYMELASNGYVVAALDHPHHAFFTKDTGGRMVTVDKGFLNTAMTLNDGDSKTAGPEKRLQIYREWMDLRTGDMNFAVDMLKQAKADGGPSDSWFFSEENSDAVMAAVSVMDSDKIGLMGHSMGGATSVALGRERDDIDAVIDIDGTMLSEYTGLEDGKYTVNEDPYEVPVLEFVNWDSYQDYEESLDAYIAENDSYPNDELMKHAKTGFTTTIRDTKHMDFTDLPLLSPALGNMLGSGERNKAETMNMVNSIVLQFCNCYLKDKGGFEVQDIY